MADVDEWIDTEDLVEELATSAQAIYESRRRNEYPGRLGHRRGRKLKFLRSEINDWLESIPHAVSDGTGTVKHWVTDSEYGQGETSNDVDTAILWALQGIKKTLDAIHNELRAQRPQRLGIGELLLMDEEGEEE